MEGGMWGKIRGAVDPNYSWKQEVKRQKAEESDDVIVEKIYSGEGNTALEMNELSQEEREIMEHAAEGRSGLLNDVILIRLRKLAEKNPKVAKFFGEGGNHVQGLGDIKMLIESAMNAEIISGKKLKPLKRYLNGLAGTCGLMSLYLGGGSLSDLFSGNVSDAGVRGGVALVVYGVSSISTWGGNAVSLDLQLGSKLANLMNGVVQYLESKKQELVELVNSIPDVSLPNDLVFERMKLKI